MIRRPPRSPLFPSPTLFRSGDADLIDGDHDGKGHHCDSRQVGQEIRVPQTAARRRATHKTRQSAGGETADNQRSEEHTSELQSPCNLVCRLLLEKKTKHTRRRIRNFLTHRSEPDASPGTIRTPSSKSAPLRTPPPPDKPRSNVENPAMVALRHTS